MTSKLIKKLLIETMSESEKYKLCLIEDIIKARSLMFGMGEEKYKHIILAPEDTFDSLYDMNINELQIVETQTSREAVKLMTIKLNNYGK